MASDADPVSYYKSRLPIRIERHESGSRTYSYKVHTVNVQKHARAKNKINSLIWVFPYIFIIFLIFIISFLAIGISICI